MRRDIIIFDIETVSDAEAARRLLRQPELSDEQARDELSAYFLEKTDNRSDFPRQPFHQVVAIAYAHMIREPGEQGTEYVIRRLASGGKVESTERELLQGFFGLIERRAPQLVTFNGRSFDLSVLKYRAMAHGISCPRWFNEGDKWNSYSARYSTQYHLDLLEVFSDYGASARCSMDEVAACLGIPGKLDTAGDQVREMFERGDIEGIRRYCETDVCTTVLLFLRWQLFTGALSAPAFARACDGFYNYLAAERERRPWLGAYLDAWDQLR
ncbi:MAG: hypothetical protein D6678_07830 [Zetaproteobacteria bacterium]|nr:MAG: hypothetical protein D6678_07830 [Zetaproteobacteria bacterium]